MPDNPYKAPNSEFEKPPRDAEPGSLLIAVMLGVSTDIGGTILVSILLAVAYQVILSTQGMSPEQVQVALEHIDPASAFGVISTLCGLSMSAAGGYVCARSANVNTYTAVGIMSAISVAFGTAMSTDDVEWPIRLLFTLLGVLGNFAGGWWFIRRLTPAAE